MKTLLITACGLSSRFEGLRPKWMLTHPNGNLMLTQSVSGLDFSQFDKIYFTFLSEHFEKYDCLDGIMKCIARLGIGKKSEIILLSERTKDQAHTVHKALTSCNIQGSFLVKEIDNYFEYDCKEEGNVVCYCDLNDITKINPSNKGYVILEDDSVIKMVEKEVVSSTFSCGGYQFNDAKDFCQAYEALVAESSEPLYLSKVIDFMIFDGKKFKSAKVKNYHDWGTREDWFEYRSQFATIFSDLDGTLVTSSGEYFPPFWEEAKPIQKNINKLNELYDSGKTKIIITTSRRSSAKELTIKQLKKLNIKYHDLILDLHHSQRILLNDFAPSNPYPTAKAFNLKRNDDNLDELLCLK